MPPFRYTGLPSPHGILHYGTPNLKLKFLNFLKSLPCQEQFTTDKFSRFFILLMSFKKLYIASLIPLFALNTFATELEIPDIIKKIKFTVDFQLRHENIYKKYYTDVSRQRYKLRFGLDFYLPKNVKLGTRISSGTGYPGSALDTFTNLSGEKKFWIDRAYMQWQLWDFLTLTGGKMPNPFWTTFSQEMVWDGNLSPEGFAQQIKTKNGRFFLNLLQMVANEDSSNQHDQWMIGEQAGFSLDLYNNVNFTLAAAYYLWTYVDSAPLGIYVMEGNRRVGTTSQLANRFAVGDITAQLKTSIGSFPVNFQATYINNLRSRLNPKENIGYKTGIIFNKAKQAGSWEIGYFYEYIETDATIADLTDPTFGDGGTNRKGHIVWFAYAPMNNTKLRVRYYNTKVVNENLPPNKDDIHKLQFDLILKLD
ncbi:MAG TPA: putative porin [Elusimicrobiales bacterium]|nr:putative porin [Elusimicrobiales bacterium]